MLPAETVDRFATTGGDLTVDLVDQVVVDGEGSAVPFECNPYRRSSLLEGLDDIDMTLALRADIDAFTARDRLERPWIQAPLPLDG